MSDIAIEFRVKNGRLKRAILAKWESYAQFCRANHLRYGALNDLLGMRKPAYKLGGWTSNAMDIATALHREPEELWPEEMRRAALHKNSGEFDLTLSEAASLAAPQMERLAFGELTKGLRPNVGQLQRSRRERHSMSRARGLDSTAAMSPESVRGKLH